MTTTSKNAAFSFRFVDTNTGIHLELTNCTEVVRSISILTIFLKDTTPRCGPSRVHLRFDRINAMQPNEKAVVVHRTWINGAPVKAGQDQLGRLKVIAGAVKPYVLEISWEDQEGNTRFQRIPVGH